MPHLLRLALAFLIPLGLASRTARGDDPLKGTRPPKAGLSSLHLLSGPWDGGMIHGESVLFKKAGDARPSAKLLLDARSVSAVRSADGLREFQAGRDYEVALDGSGLTLLPGTTIPFLKTTDFFLMKGSPNSLPHRTGHPDEFVLFDNGHFFHDHQVEVTYDSRSAPWPGVRPKFAGSTLPKTLAKLRAQQPLTLCVSGDSISEGYNASRFTKVAPFQPPYPDLVKSQLEASYGSSVTLHNLAVGGWNVGQGVKDLDNLLKRKPDLVVIAYGMNDVGARNPGGFKASVATMLQRIHEADPTTEVILVASMTGNPEWVHTPPEMFPAYRDALAALEGPGVALADLTSLWRTMLKRKRDADFTGNGVNHPNDHGHRLYARVILALLADPTFRSAR